MPAHGSRKARICQKRTCKRPQDVRHSSKGLFDGILRLDHRCIGSFLNASEHLLKKGADTDHRTTRTRTTTTTTQEHKAQQHTTDSKASRVESRVPMYFDISASACSGAPWRKASKGLQVMVRRRGEGSSDNWNQAELKTGGAAGSLRLRQAASASESKKRKHCKDWAPTRELVT